jgi:sialate O-acetylesterase
MLRSILLRTSSFILLASAPVSHAEVKLHPLFSDHVVLQRDLPAPVWGTAAPGEKVTVEFGGHSVGATADADGRWMVELPSSPASAEFRVLSVKAGNTVTVNDVVVGDVFLASGQSNMDSPLSSGSAAEALPAASDPLLRFFTVTKTVAAEPQPEVKGQWLPTTPDNAKGFSAVAYFFAREIRETQKVPVGVIRSAWGGTPIKTWMSLESLRQEPAVAATLKEWDDAHAKHTATKDQPELMDAYYKDMKDWETNVEPAFKAAKKAHPAAVAAAKAAGQAPPPSPQPERPEPAMPNPIAMPAASKRPSVPTISYNAMIAPLAPYGLKGILWYQGEADGSRGAEYRVLFPRLIEGWRADFRQPQLHFLFVQIPASGTDTEPVASQGMAFLRAAQASALKLPATGMAVTLDIGEANDAHPDNKIHVGRRLALVGREKVYGEKIVSSGPVYQSHEIKDGAAHVKFDHIGGGLTIGEAPWRAKSMPQVPLDRLLGFALAGVDGKWFAAEARIEGDAVVVSSTAVPEPAAVAYGWAGSPAVNLYNKEGLPAAPFRTDTPR